MCNLILTYVDEIDIQERTAIKTTLFRYQHQSMSMYVGLAIKTAKIVLRLLLVDYEGRLIGRTLL